MSCGCAALCVLCGSKCVFVRLKNLSLPSSLCSCPFVRWCSSVLFVWLPFIIHAAPNFFSDPDPLVLKALHPCICSESD